MTLAIILILLALAVLPAFPHILNIVERWQTGEYEAKR
jgi:hypothetical protein